MDLITLCDGIQLQAEIREQVMEYGNSADFRRKTSAREGLKRMETEGQARAELEGILEPDPGKIKMLTCMLLCGAEQYSWYEEKGIPETVFWDTMGCFTRFIKECREKTGAYAFDREWWTARQISGKLFRIGALEYERKERDGRKEISMHIPSQTGAAESCAGPCPVGLEHAGWPWGQSLPMDSRQLEGTADYLPHGPGRQCGYCIRFSKWSRRLCGQTL